MEDDWSIRPPALDRITSSRTMLVFAGVIISLALPGTKWPSVGLSPLLALLLASRLLPSIKEFIQKDGSRKPATKKIRAICMTEISRLAPASGRSEFMTSKADFADLLMTSDASSSPSISSCV